MTVANLDELKKKIFFDMLDLIGRVFILAHFSPDVVIGNRGFSPEEKEKGMVLVFNRRMNFEWDAEGISAKLVFGSATHECFIPHDAIVSVFSPELSAQFSISPGPVSQVKEEGHSKKRPSRPREKTVKSPHDTAKPSLNKVVRVDFNKKSK